MHIKTLSHFLFPFSRLSSTWIDRKAFNKVMHVYAGKHCHMNKIKNSKFNDYNDEYIKTEA